MKISKYPKSIMGRTIALRGLIWNMFAYNGRFYKCPNCKTYSILQDDGLSKFDPYTQEFSIGSGYKCPHCGAKMDSDFLSTYKSNFSPDELKESIDESVIFDIFEDINDIRYYEEDDDLTFNGTLNLKVLGLDWDKLSVYVDTKKQILLLDGGFVVSILDCEAIKNAFKKKNEV